jgi:hypothetical protein
MGIALSFDGVYSTFPRRVGRLSKVAQKTIFDQTVGPWWPILLWEMFLCLKQGGKSLCQTKDDRRRHVEAVPISYYARTLKHGW